MYVIVSGNLITAGVSVYYETGYAGPLPGMIIRQPGQNAITASAAGGATAWEVVSTAFTPSANPPYIVVEFYNGNTAAGGEKYATYFDTFWVSG